jgi:SAM-dependent methyltransferase
MARIAETIRAITTGRAFARAASVARAAKDVSATAYEPLAHEYYDNERHPTCNAFRHANELLLMDSLVPAMSPGSVLLEIGAGQSLMGEVGPSLEGITRIVSDASRGMLGPKAPHERSVVCDARKLAFRDRSVDILAALLGDPYNTPSFWAEVRRVLRPQGIAIFTTPSWEWAVRYRSAAGESISEAVFRTDLGQLVSVPSFIFPSRKQAALLSSQGLVVDRIAEVSLSRMLQPYRTSKLTNYLDNYAPVVVGYMIRLSQSGWRLQRRRRS